MIVGVLALQGAFAAHVAALARIGVNAVEVRTPEDLSHVDALVMPGGESTTMGLMLERSGLKVPLAERLGDGLFVMATCAGLILLASKVDNAMSDLWTYGVLDVDVERNAYGRQNDSFEAALDLGEVQPFHGVFIRAPRITRVGPDVQVLAHHGESPVLVQAGPILAATFHPELTPDLRLHHQFLRMVGHAAGQDQLNPILGRQ